MTRAGRRLSCATMSDIVLEKATSAEPDRTAAVAAVPFESAMISASSPTSLKYPIAFRIDQADRDFGRNTDDANPLQRLRSGRPPIAKGAAQECRSTGESAKSLTTHDVVFF